MSRDAEEFDELTDPCELAPRWGISVQLATRLVALSRELPYRVAIISGYRDRESQDELSSRGRPTAPPELSTHLTCPATGADLRPLVGFVSTVHKVELGRAAAAAGLRWGGGSRLDADGIPSDWNHVDLGPRMDSIAQAYRSNQR